MDRSSFANQKYVRIQQLPHFRLTDSQPFGLGRSEMVLWAALLLLALAKGQEVIILTILKINLILYQGSTNCWHMGTACRESGGRREKMGGNGERVREREMLKYGTFCRETLKYCIFCHKTLKYGTFCRKTLKYALRENNSK